jgi:hypothetical protein
MTQLFDFSLTDADIDLTREFMMCMTDDGKEYFTTDDLRRHGLDRNFSDPAHEVGAFWAKLVANGVIVAVGEEPSVIGSNNKRKVDLCRFDWHRWRMILRSRLP